MAYASAMDALGDPTRRRIFELLQGGPRAVGELAGELPVSRPAVSQHLRVLKDAGLVSERRDGTRRLYRVDPNGLRDVRDYFDRFWETALASFESAVALERRGEGMNAQQTDLTIRRSGVVTATPEKAFQVFTEGIADWWPYDTHSVEGMEGEDRSPETVIFEPGPNGRIYERMTNGKEAHWANVTAWEPPHRVVLAWQVNPDTPGPTEIEMRFTPEGDGTRFEFEHRGWEVLGADAEKAAGQYDGGWFKVLGRYEQAF